MKVVINTCYGGFGLSRAAIRRYGELAGFTPTFWKNTGKVPRISTDDSEGSSFLSVSTDGKSPYDKKGNCAPGHWHYSDLKRNDPVLVQVVDELGKKASGDLAELHVVDIPDGVVWQIEEYDGKEHVAEVHDTWH